MIKIFRNLRKKLIAQNKVKNYFLYAIGEIILVVIGILIALQINNWNEERKSKIQEQIILKNLVQDLKADSLSFSKNLKILTDINSLHKALYEIGVNKKDNFLIENPQYIRRLLYYNPIMKENDPLVSNKLSSKSIRKEILNYFRYLKDMDNSYGEFEVVIQDRMRVFLSKNEMHDLSGWFENKSIETNTGIYQDIIRSEDLILLSKMPEFQQLLFEASIKSRERKESNLELKMLNGLSNDLANNKAKIASMISRDSSIIVGNQHILTLLKDNSSVFNDSLQFSFSNINRYDVFFPQGMAYESLKSEGFHIIKNDSLRAKIIELYDESYFINSHIRELRSKLYTGSNEKMNKRFFTTKDINHKVPNNFDDLKKDTEFLNTLSHITAENLNFQTYAQTMLSKTISTKMEIDNEIKKFSK